MVALRRFRKIVCEVEGETMLLGRLQLFYFTKDWVTHTVVRHKIAVIGFLISSVFINLSFSSLGGYNNTRGSWQDYRAQSSGSLKRGRIRFYSLQWFNHPTPKSNEKAVPIFTPEVMRQQTGKEHTVPAIETQWTLKCDTKLHETRKIGERTRGTRFPKEPTTFLVKGSCLRSSPKTTRGSECGSEYGTVPGNR